MPAACTPQLSLVFVEDVTEHRHRERSHLARLDDTTTQLAKEVAEKIANLEAEQASDREQADGFAASVAQLRKAVTQAEGHIKRLKQQVDTVKATESVQKAQMAVAQRYGAWPTVAIFALASIAGALAFAATTLPALQVLLGASGGVAGLTGAAVRFIFQPLLVARHPETGEVVPLGRRLATLATEPLERFDLHPMLGELRGDEVARASAPARPCPEVRCVREAGP